LDARQRAATEHLAVLMLANRVQWPRVSDSQLFGYSSVP
jgi:hypothetical protein